jgi:hypothetical protein
MTFGFMYFNNMIILEEINEYIEEWHESDSEDPIYTYLGLTEREYVKWVEIGILIKDR